MKTKKTIQFVFSALLSVVLISGCAAQDPPASTEPAPEAAATETAETPATEASETPETESPAPQDVELIISAAMSLKDVTEDLADAYKAENPHVTLTFTYGASGALQTQIEEGAPSDIFMSAAPKQMNALAEKGLIHESSRNVATNEIVLVVPVDSQAGIESFEDAATDKVSMIGLADPETMPIAALVQEIFTGLGIADAVNAKANIGSDVRQILAWVETGEVDCGTVFKTDAVTTDKVKIVATADKESHSPSLYPVGIIESSANKDEAQKFIDFLFTDEGKSIFEENGFSTID